MEVSFYCRESKTNRQGIAPIEMSIHIGGKRVFINLDRKEQPSAFKKSILQKKPNEVKDYLDATRRNVNTALTEIADRGMPLTTNTLRDYLRGGGFKSLTIADVWDEYMSILSKRVGKSLTIGTIQKYEKVRERFSQSIDFQKPITAIANKTVADFYYTLQKGYSESSAGGMMTKLKSVITYAIDNGYMKINPFSTVRISKGKPTIEYLTENELQLIKAKEMPNMRLKKVRDLSLFQAASGLSYADLALLKPEDMKETDSGVHYIKGRRAKTGIEYTSVILPFGLEIWRKYSGVLPLLSNQRYNSYLKEIEAIVGLEKGLHSHIFRKTYATMLLNRGVRMETVSKALGHSSTKITQAYYAKMQDSTITSEISSVF